MRVTSTVDRLDVAPGGTGVVPLEVVNTSDVIESLSVRALGVPEASVLAEPEALALFPDAAGALTLTVGLPATFPAGTYPVTFVVAGHAPGAREAYHEVDIVVPAHPSVRLDAAPSVVRARGRGAFTVEVRNDGNVPLDVALRAQDGDRTVRTTITPSTLSVPPGGVATSTVVVKGPRQLLGSDHDRPVRVLAEAPGAEASVGLVLRQRSTFSRGLITVLVLLAIVVAWALAFLLGTRQVLGADAFTKTAPPSFFAATKAGGGGADGAAGAAPAGALAKDGPLPAGVGATLTGTVWGAADHQGVGRVTVVALRHGRDDELIEVSSAATQADGTYTMSGLFPGAYLLRVTADGYDEVWHPQAVSEVSAQPVDAVAREATTGADLTITGHPASLSGKVDTRDESGEPVPVTVTARPAWNGADPTQQWETTADADGAYAFADLPAPGTYALTFSAEGYQPTTTTERVLGGQDRFALDVTLGAGTGSIAGTVTDGSDPLGGVQVTTTVAGKELVVGTPTVGSVGRFVVPNLPTPGTYVLTFGKEGFGSTSVAVDLGPGEVRGDLEVALSGGSGTVTGRVVDRTGAGLGGVTVTVGGAAGGLATTTLTSGQVGTYTLTGLAPGTVTLAFTKAGYAPVSVPVTVPGSGPGTADDVRLTPSTGSLTGRVTQGGTGLVGATVRATDGLVVHETTSTAAGASGTGTYVLSDLPAGTYTITVVVSDEVVATSVVHVAGGAATERDLPVGG